MKLKQETVTTAAEVEANRLVEIDFTTGAPQQSITLEQLFGGDNIIWFDKFALYEVMKTEVVVLGILKNTTYYILHLHTTAAITNGC